MDNKKIALVCQRYGEDVNGGAEYYARQLAERLSERYDVEILTTTAIDHISWDKYYSVGCKRENKILVNRFFINHKRNWNIMNNMDRCNRYFKINFKWINKIWIAAQGPYVPDLVKYIKKYKNEYKVFIFVTYLYYPTVFGMPKVGKKSIFVPTAHEEYMINFKIFQSLFKIPQAIVYLTEEEKKFVQQKFYNKFVKSKVMAMGIELPEIINVDNFMEKYSIREKYIIYAGRVEIKKGCQEMFDFFMRYLEKNDKISLVILGKTEMEIPKCSHIKYLGYLPEEEKLAAIKGSCMLWMPSEFESLSIVLLESMALGRPVIANGKSEVLKGHCDKSGAGISYRTYEQFEEGMLRIIGEYENMSRKAKIYVEEHYKWDSVMEEWISLIENI